MANTTQAILRLIRHTAKSVTDLSFLVHQLLLSLNHNSSHICKKVLEKDFIYIVTVHISKKCLHPVITSGKLQVNWNVKWYCGNMH